MFPTIAVSTTMVPILQKYLRFYPMERLLQSPEIQNGTIETVNVARLPLALGDWSC